MPIFPHCRELGFPCVYINIKIKKSVLISRINLLIEHMHKQLQKYLAEKRSEVSSRVSRMRKEK